MSKNVLNFSEATLRRAIEPLCRAYGVELHSKMRVADTFDICRGQVGRRLFQYYLSAHFDLVLSFGNCTIFAIEFDGPGHQEPGTARRDDCKDALAYLARFPIMRVRPCDLEPDAAPLLGRLRLRLQFFDEAKSALVALGCPRCQAPLVQRVSAKGIFFGCSMYSKNGCSGSRNVSEIALLP